MKKLILIVICFITVTSCEPEKLNLELFSPDAFAFTMEEGWELNATVNVKGFKQISEEDVCRRSV
jgi:hypothetical protein